MEELIHGEESRDSDDYWTESFQLLEKNEELSSAEEEEEDNMADQPSKLTPSPPLSRIGVNTDKAGMEGLDKSKINQIIVEASKGSKFYNRELEREKVLSHRIKKMQNKLKQLTRSELLKAEQEADVELQQLEATRDLSRIIVHIDMDAFYAAVEMRDNPHLKDVPMAVGGASMLSTSNYLARRFGVRAAMPGFIGKKLCPDLVIVKPNFEKYREVCEEVRSILREYDPNFSPMGLDESYLDITEYVNKITADRWPLSASKVTEFEDLNDHTPNESTNTLYDDTHGQSMSLQNDSDDLCQEYSCFEGSAYLACVQSVVKEIRQKIEEKTNLTASAGIAPNTMLAKITSNINKPNGQFFLEPSREKVMDFIRKLPIRKLFGIGKVSEKMLNALGIETCQDMFEKRGALKLLFSDVSSHNFFRMSLGLGSTEVNNDWERKSLSTERTFSELSSPKDLLEKCRELCHSLAREIAEERLKGRTITLKIKTVSFEVKQRSQTTSHPVSSFTEIYQIAQRLVQSEMKACYPAPLRLRLMGVRLSGLERPGQSSPLKRGHTPTLDRYFGTRQVKNDKEIDMEPENKRAKLEEREPRNTEKAERVICPVCSESVSDDNVQLNQHIDECLNRTVLEAV